MNRINRLVAACMAVLISLTVGLAPASAAAQPDQPPPSGTTVSPFIIGGHPASEAYSGIVSVQIVRGGDPSFHTCTGTLVFGRWVQTAGHCAVRADGTPRPADMLHVRIGSTDRTSGGVDANVSEVLPHAEFDWATGPDRVADTAMLRLDRYVQLQPFEIAPRVNTRGTADVRLLGWGSTEPDGTGPLPVHLQELDTRLLPADRCAAGGITAGELCVANRYGTDGPCFGDSGGPALQQVTAPRWQLVGIASREIGTHCGIGPAIYTDATAYRDWAYQVARTGVVPPRAQGNPAPAAQVLTNGTRWLCRSQLELCS